MAQLRIAQAAVEHPLYASTEEVEEFAANLPDRFLYCREMGHNWAPFSGGSHPDGGFIRILRCARCHTERHQELSPRGAVIRSHYDHPEGYLNKGFGRIVGEGRDVLRLASITRTITRTAKKAG